MTPRHLRRSLTSAVLIVLAWSAPVLAVPIVFSAGGAITTTVDSFRAALSKAFRVQESR